MSNNTNNPSINRLNTIRQASEFLAVNPGTIRRWAINGTLKGIKVGTRGDWRFEEKALEKLISLPNVKKDQVRKFVKIKKLLKENLDSIQKLATTHHTRLIGGDPLPPEHIVKYKEIHMKMVRAIANNLDNREKGIIRFNALGIEIAESAVKDNLSIEEAVDGTIFLKDAIWKKLDETGLLKELSTQELFEFSQLIGAYCDILSSKIAFTYHNVLTERITGSESLFKALTEKSADAIALVNKKGKVLQASPSTKDILGYTPLEFMNLRNPFDLVPPNERKFVTLLFEKLLMRPGSTERVKYKILHKKGYTVWVESVMTNLLENKDVHAVVINYSNINNRVLIEEKLQKSEERFRTLLSANSDAIYRMDPKWETMHELYGNSFINDTKKPTKNWMQKYIPSDERRKVKVAIAKCLKTKSVFELEHRVMRMDGTLGWSHSRAMPIIGKDGKIIEWFGSFSNISEQKELEQQKDNFLGIVSHELKTPVTSIKAYTQVLELMFRKSGDIKTAELLGKMDAQVSRLNNLITDLLDVTKIQSGKMQFNDNIFDFNELVLEVIEEVQRTSLNHTIVNKLTSSKSVWADRERIRQVVTNFLTNAIKYSPHGDKIIVSTTTIKNTISLYVKDFGIGITKSHRNKVFEQYFRVNGDVHNTFPGLGLGLYISSEIIMREGGKIGIKGTGKNGSTFYFSLPINAGKDAKNNKLSTPQNTVKPNHI